jgi:hypothetical protein
MYASEQQASMPRLWFGRHKGQALSEIDTSYLVWAARTVKLSSATRRAVEAELQSRGAAVPAPPPRPWAGWMGPCQRCGCATVGDHWLEQRDGRRVVRASCPQCKASLGTAPSVEPYTTLADQAASETPTLDALTLAEEEGVKIVSDGASAWCEPWGRASERLRQLVRERGNLLARMIGDTTRATR